MNKNNSSKDSMNTLILGALAGILFIFLILAQAIFPEKLWITIVVGVLLVGTLGVMVQANLEALKSRQAKYGTYTVAIFLIVFGILSVVNFLSYKHPFKYDSTKNHLHTFSDETIKLIKGLQTPVKAVFYTNTESRDQFRPLFENYKALSPKFEVEYVDPNKEPTRVKTNGIRTINTLQLLVNGRDSKVDKITEEGITNALVKLLKDKQPTVCTVTGHGEHSFTANDQEGFESAKKALENVAYVVKEINIVQDGKIPDECGVLVIMGPTKAFFDQEIKIISAYLDNGGRALVGEDLILKGGDASQNFNQLLASWKIQPDTALIVDPQSRMFQMDAAVAITKSYAKESPITKDFNAATIFSISRPLTILPGDDKSPTPQWLVQTSPTSFAVSDMKAVQSGEIGPNVAKKQGPLTIGVTVDGKKKDSKAAKNTRLVVFGSASFANNYSSRFAGNLDLFTNSISWLLEDESMISIHTKEDSPGKIEIDGKVGSFIGYLTVFIIPVLIAGAGVGIWFFRRKL